MKTKTIAKTIRAKMEAFLASINDKLLQEALREGIVVTGGCITSMYLQENVNDYDVYLSSPRLALRVAKYYAENHNLSGDIAILLHTQGESVYEGVYYNLRQKMSDDLVEKYQNTVLLSDPTLNLTSRQKDNLTRVEMFVSSSGLAEEKLTEGNNPAIAKEPLAKYRPVFISSNAITLSDSVQLILRFTGNAAVIHTNYDFAHTTNYWTYAEGLVTNTKALECILAKELKYTGSLYPLASIMRTRKFINRGWSVHVGNYIKMALQLNELNLFEPDVLRDQLTGVDMAYMQEVISEVESKAKAEPDFKFNACYLCELVERLMGDSE